MGDRDDEGNLVGLAINREEPRT